MRLPTGPLEQAFGSAAAEFHVPETVLLSVGYHESLWDSHRGEPSTTGTAVPAAQMPLVLGRHNLKASGHVRRSRMPRPIWTGAIAFGLVTIPIKVAPASESHAISFHRIHLEDGGRVRNRKVCELDGNELREDEIGRGYEVSKDRIFEVTDEDLDELPLPTAKAIDIVAFVDRSSIDPVRIGQSYYLVPDGQVAAKPYTLLRRALERSEKVAIAKFALRNRERLGLLSLLEDALVLHSMHWPDEIRDPSELAPDAVDLDEDEIEHALALMDSMSADDVSQYRDQYKDALDEVIAAKVAGKKPPAPPTQDRERSGQVVDLMAALEESVQQARKSRGESNGDATVHDMPRKKAARKAPAKKTAARKTSSRKPRSA